MNYETIAYLLEREPAIRLLQMRNAAFVIGFLYRAFKQAHRLTVPSAELTEQLEAYQEEIRQCHPDLYPQPAKTYLDTWCDDDHQVVRQYYERYGDDPVFELTPGTEKAMAWLEGFTRRPFIGAESRFLHIFDLLEEIARESTSDVETRLAFLERQQAVIQEEIATIRQTGEVPQFTTTQMSERFLEANHEARRLLADFKEVEQNFRDITRAVREEHLKEGVRKGSVVAHVIQEDEALKQSDQGRSFYAFWEFLMSPSKQDELHDLLTMVYSLPCLGPLSQEERLLWDIKPRLIDAGEKIVQSNYRLAEQLRRILDEQHIQETRRVLELAADIKKLALEMMHTLPAEDDALSVEIEGPPDIRLPMERPLWTRPDEAVFNTWNVSRPDEATPGDIIRSLRSQFYVDEAILKQQIGAILENRPEITLAELTTYYPVQKGLPEIIAYFSLAASEERHTIHDGQCEQITFHDMSDHGQRFIRMTLPQVVFRR
ncbi:MAG: DUF3375 domain-containing protein [Chloroflexaceae bacterium]|nr:DUF3375 domain-containing protein [Chloroflexaceae bacterium]